MKLSRQTAHRSALPLLFLMLGLALVSADLALASITDLYGGPGGNPFWAQCPQGSYLVGLAGRTGEWVDRIAPICAPWLRGSQTLGIPSIGQSFGMSTGGEERQVICRGSGVNTLAVHSWTIAILRSDNHFVQYVWGNCATFAPLGAQGYMEGSFDFGSPPSAAPGDEKISNERVTTGPNKTQWTTDQSCPAGEAAVGIRIRAGQFVDAIGLICGPLPAKLGAPATKMIMPDAMFVIVKPGAGEKIPHGQLVITAMEPKVGSTNVAELELRYLDAPANQQHSYPYATIVSVNKAQLLAGYLVSERVTGGYVGRWQVRARASMKAVPGPWSLPVQFQLVVTQPTQSQSSTLPQSSALPPSSIVQPPPQGGSAVPQMIHPPTTPSQGPGAFKGMIRKRGVEEKGGEETNQTVDAPAETEKKP